MFGALARLLTSSTFWSAVFALFGHVVATKNGIPLPPEAVAAVPLAVAWKEGKRREAEAELAAEISARNALHDARSSTRAAAAMLHGSPAP